MRLDHLLLGRIVNVLSILTRILVDTGTGNSEICFLLSFLIDAKRVLRIKAEHLFCKGTGRTR